MRALITTFATFLLIMGSNLAHSDVYTWVDKDGKKHFGQEVPKEYAKKSTVIEVKTVNSMDETKTRPSYQSTNTPSYQQSQLPATQDNYSGNLSSCEQQKRAYEDSVACYARCRLPKDDFGKRVNNVSGCTNCVDVKKPNC